jgi:Histidine kinase-like ATPase domain
VSTSPRLDSSGVVRAGRTATASRPAHLADGTDSRWLMLAAEMAGLTRDGRGPGPDPRHTGRRDPPPFATLTPGTDAGSVRAARDFTLATLRRWDAAERGEDITIVVAELLANALRHALPGSGGTQPGRPLCLGLLHPGPGVLCAVADPSQAAPVLRAHDSLAETGRGLHIIGALSDAWGYSVLSGSGKVVWAAFVSQPQPPPPAQYPGRLGTCARQPRRCPRPA